VCFVCFADCTPGFCCSGRKASFSESDRTFISPFFCLVFLKLQVRGVYRSKHVFVTLVHQINTQTQCMWNYKREMRVWLNVELSSAEMKTFECIYTSALWLYLFRKWGVCVCVCEWVREISFNAGLRTQGGCTVPHLLPVNAVNVALDFRPDVMILCSSFN